MATQFKHSTDGLQAFGLRSHGPNPSGTWKLAEGSAVTLHDGNAAVLRITHGRVWATVDGPHCGPANNQGDLVLTAGERLTVQAGQRVVIEPWSSSASSPSSANQAVYFSWDPALASTRVSLPGPAQAGWRMQLAVVCPLRDFGQALKMATHALGRLAWGIAGLLAALLAGTREFLTAGRGRVQRCMESNPP